MIEKETETLAARTALAMLWREAVKLMLRDRIVAREDIG
jgi:hypothetical protein